MLFRGAFLERLILCTENKNAALCYIICYYFTEAMHVYITKMA